MTFRDKITMATGNLWRMKLRAFLTISGVVIAIAAFVAMLSFGAGMQENISREFNQLGLFSTIHVYPQREENGTTDTTRPSILDDAAVQMLADIPGVTVAYPFDDFDVTVQWGDSTINTTAQALPTAAVGTKLFSRMEAGSAFESDTSRQVLVTDSLLALLHVDNPDSMVGQRLIISVMQPTIDSAVINVFKDKDGVVRRRLRDIKYDSLLNPDYLRQTLRTELSDALKRFVDGYIHARAKISDTFVVSGVLKSQEHGRQRLRPVVVPMAAAGNSARADCRLIPKICWSRWKAVTSSALLIIVRTRTTLA